MIGRKFNPTFAKTELPVADAAIPLAPFEDGAIIDNTRADFDQEWYELTYAAEFKRLRAQGETSFDFYLRCGARRGHDPNPNFSEVLYRAHNLDVRKHIMNTPDAFGFRHYVQFGIAEENRVKFSRDEAVTMRNLILALDRDFLIKTYGRGARRYPDIVDLYIDRAYSDLMSPSAEFSEAGYLELNPDIEPSLKSGAFICGYDHFLRIRGKEMRGIISHADYLEQRRLVHEAAAYQETHLALESSLPGITHLTALDMLGAMEFYDGALDVEVTSANGTGGLLIFVPDFLPEILFGGYMAFYDFLGKLKRETGIRLHLIVVNIRSREVYANNLLRMRLKMPEIYELFDDFQHFDMSKRHVVIPEDFQVMSYCSELHPMAGRTAARLRRKPVFFIQENESDFHANTDMRSFIDRSFLLPHHAIYNSAKLVEFFRERTSVFDKAGLDYRYACIENAIQPLKLDHDTYVCKQQAKTSRRLIMYGRPEGYAARNHFATLVYALRQATRQGLFREDAWEFSAIGSLSFKESLDLNGSQKLRMVPKMPKAVYEDYLLSGDIGISVITTPHPGIVHFQMAAYGLTTLTNRTELRDDAWLAEQNRNLVPVDMTVESIVAGLRLAVERAEDFKTRYDNAVSGHSPDPAACLRSALDFMADVVKP